MRQRSPDRWSARKGIWLLALPCAVGCGGGGAADSTTPAADPRAVLANEYDAPTVVLEAGDASMQMALLAQRAFINLGSTPQPTIERVCSAFAQGNVTYSWGDTDGNGRWSAGDTFSADFRGCRLPRLGGVVDGIVSGTLLEDPQADLGDWYASVHADAPVSLGSDGRKLQGGLRARFASTAFVDTLSLSAAAGDAVNVTTRWGVQAVVTAPASSIEWHYNLSQSRVRLQFSLSSASLGGSVEVVPVEPFVTGVAPEPTSQYYKVPVAGALHIFGANGDRIEVAASGDAAYLQRLVRRDAAAGAPRRQVWAAPGVNESLWWIGSPLPDTGGSLVESRGAFLPTSYASDLEYPDEVTGRPRFRIYYASAVSLDAGAVITLNDTRAREGNVLDPRGVVAANILADGSGFVIAPLASLPAGRRYAIDVVGGTIRLADGTVTLPQPQRLLEFATLP